jgi:hypothetical protein
MLPCIMIFNLGAPSQQDLWDMKPDAPSEIRGPFKPIRTKSNAFEISEILPLHAKIADKFSLVRSCYHTAAAVHDTGHQMMQTGRFSPAVSTRRTSAARWSSSKAAAAICQRTSSCRKRWAPPVATCRTARTRASSARRMILSS